ncbi:MAG: septum formation initiator family protein [Deltaproteobacteria bacterium]|jgi:cell division protein FtsB|nr:septum formation initiator family protein [Deltaproteobacteria bacterium]
MVVKKPFILVRKILNSPRKVLLFSLIFLFINMMSTGNIVKLLNLKNELDRLGFVLEKNKLEIEQIEQNISKSKDTNFIERQAREKLDLVEEGDLVFIFPGDE